jgi:hypothetical protein
MVINPFICDSSSWLDAGNAKARFDVLQQRCPAPIEGREWISWQQPVFEKTTSEDLRVRYGTIREITAMDQELRRGCGPRQDNLSRCGLFVYVGKAAPQNDETTE